MLLRQRLLGITLDYVMDMGRQQFAKQIRRLPGQLRGHVVYRTHQHSGSLEALGILIPIRIVQTEGSVYRGALIHELNGATRVGGYIANGQHPMRQSGTSLAGRQPGVLAGRSRFLASGMLINLGLPTAQ